MRSLLFPKRAKEGLDDSLAASGAWSSGAGVIDPIDGDVGYRRLGAGNRDVPSWTLTKVRALSVHAYRANPMARAILDTYTSFCVGDSGLTLHGTDPGVREAAERFWTDARNGLARPDRQELLLRSHMLMGETPLEVMVGEMSGATRFSYIDPDQVAEVEVDRGNALWPSALRIRSGLAGTENRRLEVVRTDDLSELLTGEVMWWSDWKATASDRRGTPFLAPVLDWLQSYDDVLWNLIDRTALARYMVWDVEVQGGQDEIDQFIAARQGSHPPRSGSVEVHNEGVTWTAKTAQPGSYEDRVTGQSVLTSVAAGAGLAKTWLAEPEDANRATSLTMAEPVRRRVGGVQNLWLSHMTELVRFSIDQAVAKGRLPREITLRGEAGEVMLPASQTVEVTGPEIAATDAQVNAEILLKLGAGLSSMVHGKLMTPAAAKIAAKKAWEDYVGVPYRPELDTDDTSVDDLADYLDDAEADRVAKAAAGLIG